MFIVLRRSTKPTSPIVGAQDGSGVSLCSNCAYYGVSHPLYSVVFVHGTRGVYLVMPGVSVVSVSQHATHQPGHASSLPEAIPLGSIARDGQAHHHARLFLPPDISTQQMVGHRAGEPAVGRSRAHLSVHALALADRRLLGWGFHRHHRHAGLVAD